MFVFTAFLFFVLTPGILLSLPPKGSKMMVAGVHAIVFALVLTFTHKLVFDFGVSSGLIMEEGYSNKYVDALLQANKASNNSTAGKRPY
jgi:hypothetical protein